jgi:hypothetical protein
MKAKKFSDASMMSKVIVFGLTLILGFSGLYVTVLRDGGADLPRTTLYIANTSGEDSVLTYLTLGADTSFITDVNGIFGISASGLQGSFYLLKDTVYVYNYQGKGLSGNISFGTPPLNCPDSAWITGNNLFEVTINNAGTVSDAQETIDISNVAGSNAFGSYTLSGGGEWIANSAHINILYFKNDSMYQNVGNIGVFPFKCDDCTLSANPPVCNDILPASKPQTEKICNVSRNAKYSGGSVKIEFLGWN